MADINKLHENLTVACKTKRQEEAKRDQLIKQIREATIELAEVEKVLVEVEKCCKRLENRIREEEVDAGIGIEETEVEMSATGIFCLMLENIGNEYEGRFTFSEMNEYADKVGGRITKKQWSGYCSAIVKNGWMTTVDPWDDGSFSCMEVTYSGIEKATELGYSVSEENGFWKFTKN